MIGFKYDGTHSDTLNIIMNKKNVHMVPLIKENFEPIPGKNGVWDFGVQYDSRPLDITCTIVASSAIDLKTKLRALVGFLNPKLGARPLIFDDEPDKLYYARLTGQLPLDQIGVVGTFTLQFICCDPFLYSIMPTTVSGTDTLSAVNNGTYLSQPIITIEHGGGAGTVEVTRGDSIVQTLTFNSTAIAGTYVVDCKEGTITKGTSGAYQYLSGDFFALSEGPNTITNTSGITSLSLVYRDTYL